MGWNLSIPHSSSKSTTTSILSLPDDVLHTIFQAVICFRHERRGRVDNSTLLSQVNRHWRHLLLTTCSLWTYITIYDKVINAEWLENILSRSGECLLHITLIGAFGSHRNADRMWRLLTSQTARWKSLEIRDVSRHLYERYFAPMEARSYPQLRSFAFIQTKPLEHTIPIPRGWISTSCLPLTQLTTIRLCPKSCVPAEVAAEALNFLRAVPGLRGLSLEQFGVRPFEDNRVSRYEKLLVPRFCHPSLEVLEICISEAVDIVLQSVELPSLRRLPQHYGWPRELLHSVVPRIEMPRLERIFLSTNAKGNIMEDLGAVNPSIREITLNYYSLPPGTLSEISNSFPQLQVLEIFNAYNLDLYELEIMVERSNLTHVSITGANLNPMTTRIFSLPMCKFDLRSDYPTYHPDRPPLGWLTVL